MGGGLGARARSDNKAAERDLSTRGLSGREEEGKKTWLYTRAGIYMVPSVYKIQGRPRQGLRDGRAKRHGDRRLFHEALRRTEIVRITLLHTAYTYETPERYHGRTFCFSAFWEKPSR